MSLQVRIFDGTITKDKGKPTEKKYDFQYGRIVQPHSRTGEDVDGNNPEGANPTLSEVMEYCAQNSFPTEIPLDDNGDPTGPSIVQFLVDGVNKHMNATAAAEVMNTEEAAYEAVVKVYMNKRKCTREEAEAKLGKHFG